MNAFLIELMQRLERLEQQIALLNGDQAALPQYSVAQFAERVQRSSYTVREWARLGRIEASRRSGRGPYREYVISHSELLRYRQQGLRPADQSDGTRGNP